MKSRAGRELMRSLVYAAGGVSFLSTLGQLTVVATIPLLTRIYSPSDFGVFTIYLGIVNILAATAALRLDVSLYVVTAGEQAHAALKLALTAIAATSLIVAGLGVPFSGSVPETLRGLVYLVPIGMATTGLVETLNCWCLRRGRLRDFAIGKFVSPVSMAFSQVSFGLLQYGSDSMVLAHILSQLLVIMFLAVRLFGWDEVKRIVRVPWRDALSIAKGEYKFPLFDLPATLLCFAIINLPAILIGALFGTSLAGHFGVATRLFSSPISLVAIPLSNVFVAESVKHDRPEDRYRTGLFLVALAGVLITLPTLGIGAAAPNVIPMLLGGDWILTGNLISALALMGAAQALSTPVQEVPILLRRQGLRLLVDAARTILVFAPIAIGVYGNWEPLRMIYAMSFGGAVGYLIRTAISLHLLRNVSRQGDVASAKPASDLVDQY